MGKKLYKNRVNKIFNDSGSLNAATYMNSTGSRWPCSLSLYTAVRHNCSYRF